MSQLLKLAPAIVAGSLALSAMAQADDYRAEIRLHAEHVDLDDNADDVDIFSASGTYYLEPVRTDGLPLAEAAYLNRSSFVNAVAANYRQQRNGNAEAYGANFGYYVPDTIFFGRLGVTHTDFGASDTRWHGTFGVTPLDGLMLTTDFDEDGWDPNVRAKHVGKIANGHYYAASVYAVDPDEGDVNVGIDFDYFLDLTFKVGAGYADGNDRISVRAEKFFTPRFALGGSVYTDDGGDGLSATLAWRF